MLLDDLTFVGTHDSGAYAVNFDWLPQPTNTLSRLQHYSCGLFNSKIKKWTITQSHSVGRQLQTGCRYLDLDVSVLGLNEFWISHTFACVPLSEVLSDIKNFMLSTREEIVIVDFSPAFDRQQLNFNPIPDLAKLILHYLGPWMSPINPWRIGVETLIRRNHRVVIVSDSVDLQANLPGVELSSRWSGSWIDTSNRETKIAGLRAQLATATMMKLEWTLTPQTVDVLGCSSLLQVAERFNTGLQEFLESLTETERQKIKIIAIDNFSGWL